MASRKEERERLRQARLEREKEQASAQRRRLMLGYVAAGVLAVAVVAGVVIAIASSGGGASASAHINTASGSTNGVEPDEREGVAPPVPQTTNLEQAAKKAGCTLRLRLPNEGATHVDPGTTVNYRTNPPTSGNHVNPPLQQADGAYSEKPEDIDLVHALEHGRMQIQYSSDLPEDAQLELKGLYDTMYGGTLLFPNDDMPYAVAATTWTNLMGCDEYRGAATLDAIRAFGRQTWGKYGGEPVDAFGLRGPTPGAG